MMAVMMMMMVMVMMMMIMVMMMMMTVDLKGTQHPRSLQVKLGAQ